MRRAAQVDANQAEIVLALRAAGASVQSLAAIGGGCPDLMVGFKGRNYILEVKNPEQRKDKQRPRATQIAWRKAWLGQAVVITTVDEAMWVIGKSEPS